MTCQLAGVQLKHQIKTPLPLPPSPPQKHRHAHVTAGTQATSARTVVSSAPRSLTGCCVLSGTLSHCKGTSGQAPPGLAARPMPGRMEAAAAAGQAWPGMSPLPAPKHAPTPHLLLRSAPASHPSLSLSLSVSLCFYVCSGGVIQSGRASWWGWWLRAPFLPSERHGR